MTDPRKNVTFVSSKAAPENVSAVCYRLMTELPIDIRQAKSIEEIFPLLSSPSYNVDYIGIDVDDLYRVDGLDAFDILRTLSTLIQCTVFRETATTRPCKRETKLVALVSDGTSPKLLKDILAMPEISFLTVRIGGRVDYDMVKRSVVNCLNNGERAPKFILDLIKEKRQLPDQKSVEIPLTTRQQQIFDIITTRGASNKHIAKMLTISESTVKLHVGSIFKKYGVKNRTQLAVFSKKKKPLTEVLAQ